MSEWKTILEWTAIGDVEYRVQTKPIEAFEQQNVRLQAKGPMEDEWETRVETVAKGSVTINE